MIVCVCVMQAGRPRCNPAVSPDGDGEAQQACACTSNHWSHNFISHLLLLSWDTDELFLSWNGTAPAAPSPSTCSDSSIQLHNVIPAGGAGITASVLESIGAVVKYSKPNHKVR